MPVQENIKCALEFGLPARRLVMIGSPSRPSRMISAFAGGIGLPPRARAALDHWFEAHAGRAVGGLDPLSLRFSPDVDAMVVHDRDDGVIPVAEAEVLVVGKAPPKQEIARMIGASREMVSRVMKDLQTSGHIRVDKRRIMLLSDMEVSSKKIREQARKAWNFKV